MTDDVKDKAIHALTIADKRLKKNMYIKWTKEAYRSKKYKPYTKVAIFNALKNNKALLNIGFKSWYFLTCPTCNFSERDLRPTDVSDYKKRHDDYSLIRLKEFPDVCTDTLDITDLTDFSKKFDKSYKKTPLTVVSVEDISLLMSDLS